MKPQHTPTPVKLDIGMGRIFDAKGKHLCTMPPTCVTYEWECRANLIVTACNTYEKDQEIKKELLECLKEAAAKVIAEGSHDYRWDQAIAKAEGK